ncbi:hypothetical protein DNTS_025425, partial [Danionella cerebrum]
QKVSCFCVLFFGSNMDSAAVPLAATQDTSGSERQLPCPVLQPLAQPQNEYLQWNTSQGTVHLFIRSSFLPPSPSESHPAELELVSLRLHLFSRYGKPLKLKRDDICEPESAASGHQSPCDDDAGDDSLMMLQLVMMMMTMMRASLLYKDVCPEQSRFLLKRRQTTAAALPGSVVCPFCFQWREPGNHHVRLRPKRIPTSRIRRLLKWETARRRLSIEQETALRKFKRASNVVMATCHICNKVSRQPGKNRELLSSLSNNSSTPGSGSRRRSSQPVIWATPKSVVDRTPSSTPRSSNTSSSSAKSSSEKSSPFARLKKILTLENKQHRKKVGLKDFLTSL